MKLAEMAVPTGGTFKGSDCEFEKLSTDTRTLEKGDLFVALKGPNFNGYEFVPTAIHKGACGLVVEEEFPSSPLPQLIVADTTCALGVIANEKRKKFKGKVVAITGSCGKTTVKGMLADICRESAPTLATQGNLNNHIGVPLTLMQLNNRYKYAVVEAGTSGKGEIKYLAEIIQPDVAVVNNVLPVHVEGIGGIDAIANEKADIYTCSPQGINAVINMENDYAALFTELVGANRKIYFGLQSGQVVANASATYVSADQIELDPEQKTARFQLKVDGDTVPVNLQVPGEHNVLNALAAAACAVALNIDTNTIRQGLESFNGVAGRMQIKQSVRVAKIIDDTYNASPGSVRAAIDYLKQHTGTVLVLGDMGELGSTASEEHRGVGEYARKAGIEQLFATGAYAPDLAKGFGGGSVVCASQEELIKTLQNQLTGTSVVLVKGSRSTRMEKVVAALTEKGAQ